MAVTEACDVYSFGTVALEILMERHQGELLSSSTLSSSLSPQNAMLHEILDQRLPPPKNQVAQDIYHAATVAIACLRTVPNSRPTMKRMSKDFLSCEKPAAAAKPYIQFRSGN